MRTPQARRSIPVGNAVTLPVRFGNDSGSYDILLCRGALATAAEYLPQTGKALVVTDSGVPADYAKAVSAACPAATIVTLPAGEASKSLENQRFLLSRMLELDFTRSDCVIAVGGGVVGDLAGFAAAVYMRGIDFYNIPTTFLSQVDSSIGGKVAVDFCGVKNVIGAFYQPRRVIIDPTVLATLNARQLHAGLAESIKMAATSDAALFEKIENCGDDIAKDSQTLDAIIEGSLRIKRDVVEADPKEKGLRKVLNFGHTIGHAIESAEGGKLLHGECIGIGMLPFSAPEARARIRAVLEKFSLPTTSNIPTETLLSYIKHDKKAANGGVNAVLVDEIGSFSFRHVTMEEMAKRLSER